MTAKVRWRRLVTNGRFSATAPSWPCARALHGPAQSHASNLVDSIVLEALDRREDATDLAQDDFVDLPLGFVAENLTLRPLVRAFVPWYPCSGTSPPPHFARHATSHAVGQTGVFDPLYALVGIMLATSLTVQFFELGERTEHVESQYLLEILAEYLWYSPM